MSVLVIGVSGAAWWAWVSVRPETEGLLPADTRDAAIQLVLAGRHLEALPYFRRTTGPGSSLVDHLNYSSVLHNASADPRIRSSVERIALMRESLRELDHAESLALTAADTGMVLEARAVSLQAWGLTGDALTNLRRVSALDPASPEAAKKARRMELRAGGATVPDQADR